MRDPLEMRLADLGAVLAFPDTPPLARSVRERIEQPRRGWFAPTGRPVGRGVALGLIAALLLVGAAAAVGIALGGLRLVFGPTSFSPPPSLHAGPGLGVETTLSAVRDEIRFTLRIPRLAGLGEPDLVYLAEPPAGGAVTLLYAERDLVPADPETGIGLIVTQFRADIGPDIFEKLINEGVEVQATSVGGHDAWWVAGGDHFFFYRDADGRMVDTTLRLAGNTLIWEERGVTHRVEGAPALDAARAVAESLQ